MLLVIEANLAVSKQRGCDCEESVRMLIYLRLHFSVSTSVQYFLIRFYWNVNHLLISFGFCH
jgi:hypothetical protein